MSNTYLKNFQTELDAVKNSSGLIAIMKTCRNKNNSVTESVLNGNTCLTNTNGVYTDANGKNVTTDIIPSSLAGLTSPYTYATLETQVFFSANNNASNYATYTSDLSQIAFSTTGSYDQSFNAYHTDTKNLYTSMVPNRAGLDEKMRQLYGKNGVSDTELQYENGVLVNLTWTVLATGVLYFLFVKL
jgi:hypothetical protein